MNANHLPMSVKEEFEAKLNLQNAFRDTAKSCIQLSTLALALPILFTQAMLGKNAAENGLRSAPGSTHFACRGPSSCLQSSVAWSISGLRLDDHGTNFTRFNSRLKRRLIPDSVRRGLSCIFQSSTCRSSTLECFSSSCSERCFSSFLRLT